MEPAAPRAVSAILRETLTRRATTRLTTTVMTIDYTSRRGPLSCGNSALPPLAGPLPPVCVCVCEGLVLSCFLSQASALFHPRVGAKRRPQIAASAGRCFGSGLVGGARLSQK